MRLLRAVAGDVGDIKIMYGLAGERDLPECELDHRAGYECSRPVRIGNLAIDQYQADVVGEVMLALDRLRDAGVAEDEYSWGLQKSLLRYCEANSSRPDHGIWEMRGDSHFFTHGRAMMCNEHGICASPNDVPGYDKEAYMGGRPYVYVDTDGNQYRLGHGLSYS